ncbi:MAG: AmmeMemoRadiSam system protein B [Deltaproteobacteria bacterium]|jgi:AmmeMemoRadiSam system protein B|nr:AmmeMemoRadiSam system protein B [Deltaproteobacteria bacterium]
MIRQPQLAGQWYPNSTKAINDQVLKWSDYIQSEPRPLGQAVAMVVPHAGWFFSGKLAARTLARAQEGFNDNPPKLVIVLGGHLGPRDPLIVYGEEAWRTPLGDLPLATSLNDQFAEFAPVLWSGPSNDNTIEVLLPLVKYYFPQASLWPVRVPPSPLAVKFGDQLAEFLSKSPDPTLVVASTDLTHYGQAYGFAPMGEGPLGDAFRLNNDRAFIEAALSLDPERILVTGQENRGSCSAGAVVVATRLALQKGAKGQEVDSYASSDIMPGPQSVGYAGLEFVL